MKGYVNGWLVVVFVLVAILSAVGMIAENRAEQQAVESVVREVFVSDTVQQGIKDGVMVWEATYQDGNLVDFISFTDKDGKLGESYAKKSYAMGN